MLSLRNVPAMYFPFGLTLVLVAVVHIPSARLYFRVPPYPSGLSTVRT